LLDNIIEGNFLPSETLWSWRNSTGRIWLELIIGILL
jgi:hypothetical protein